MKWNKALFKKDNFLVGCLFFIDFGELDSE